MVNKYEISKENLRLRGRISYLTNALKFFKVPLPSLHTFNDDYDDDCDVYDIENNYVNI